MLGFEVILEYNIAISRDAIQQHIWQRDNVGNTQTAADSESVNEINYQINMILLHMHVGIHHRDHPASVVPPPVWVQMHQ